MKKTQTAATKPSRTVSENGKTYRAGLDVPAEFQRAKPSKRSKLEESFLEFREKELENEREKLLGVLEKMNAGEAV